MKTESPTRIPLGRALLWFLLANALLLPLIFGGALWGNALLAPLDIPPALFPHYRHVDPDQDPVPANHFIVDGIFYDLPVQKTVYDAYQRGEIPWWDPYSLGGRPLLADAHINGTDPFRVIFYHLLPFELAFNWTRIAHFLFAGLAMLLLLRHLGFRLDTCVLLALAHEFAGGFAMNISHPWIQASFLYYPFLWLLWDGAWGRMFGWRDGVAGLLAAGVFYSGNLQSHTYLPLFALAFCLGYASKSPGAWKRALAIVATTGFIGACLAAPVLLNQLELYVLGVRLTPPLAENSLWKSWLSGIASLSAIYPWMFGTFRTLDVGKWIGESGLGFSVYAGSVVFCLALVGLFPRTNSAPSPAKRMAVWLLALYFGLVLSTPLKAFLYTRSSGLALLGMIVLAGFTVEWLRSFLPASNLTRRAGIWIIAVTAAIVVSSHVGAWLVYPRLIDSVRTMVLERRESSGPSVGLREFQIRNWPREVTFRNPEPLFAAAGLLALSLVLWRPSLRQRHGAWTALLLLNAVPVVLFAHRFIPRHSVELWHRLEAGGPELRRVALAMRAEERLLDLAPQSVAQLFPNELQHLQRIRTVHGYAAVQPRSIANVNVAARPEFQNEVADWIYETSADASTSGVLREISAPGLARFHWRQAIPRSFRVESHGLNRIRVTFEPGAAGELLWTDSHFPGWRATLDGRGTALQFVPPVFSAITIPADARELVLLYRPTFLRLGSGLAVIGLAGMAVCLWAGRRKPWPRSGAAGNSGFGTGLGRNFI